VFFHLGERSLKVLLVEPDYYTRYPPLGLLKLSSYHKSRGDKVEYVHGKTLPTRFREPDLIYVTSLFTYAWGPVHEAVRFYKRRFPGVKLVLGGIYASLLPDHAKVSGADEVYTGLYNPAEMLIPDYDLVPKWDGSITFASRGCVRKCGFCSVPKLEGPPNALKYSIRQFIHPKHTKVILWDNNILGTSNWKAIFEELEQLGLIVDFNQGLDARLVTEEVAELVSKLRMNFIRLAYDYHGIGPAVGKAIERLSANGVSPRKIVVYTLYNYIDDPKDLYERILDLLQWGAVSYPMKFEPLCSLQKNAYVGSQWTPEALQMVAEARRVIGYAGAFPPYRPLIEKFQKAGNFEEAFALRPRKMKHMVPTALIEQDLEINSGRISKNVRRYGGAKHWQENNLEHFLHPPQ
jgi:hypothetical protein